MELHTKIIEFVGPAACGKSTLCNLFRDRFSKKNLSVANWDDLVKKFKNQSLWKKIRSVSLAHFFLYLRMYRLAKPEKKWRRYLFLYFLKIDVLYTFAKRFSDYDFVFIEHGILQNVISTQNQVNLIEEHFFLKKINSLLESLNCIDFCIYSKVSVDDALTRMGRRNRVNDGRIDKEKNTEKKRLMLQRDLDNCTTLFNYLKSKVSCWTPYQLNAHYSVESLYQELLPLFEEKE